jgi:hypothetical protein
MPDIVEPVRRALPPVIAIVVCLWFALGVRQAVDGTRATAALARAQHVDRATATRIAAQLDPAAVLNPDQTVSILRAQLQVERGRREAGLKLLGRVIRAEPMNLEAWRAIAADATDPQTLREAFVGIGRLVPPVRSSN